MLKPVTKDPGLQRERTQLAWMRTLFLFALVGIFMLRVGMIEKSILLCLAGIVLVVQLVIVKLYQYYHPTYFNEYQSRHPTTLLCLVTCTIFLVSLFVISHYLMV